MIELLSSPEIWIGLFTLIVLEIILGIDNLVFIAILSEKLPPHQRDRARIIGLSLALLMRLGLLSIISWIATLTTPLINIFGHPFSGRDLILLFGGIFLLFKATSELHERLEGQSQHGTRPGAYASFAVVTTQIVVLDAVFSLDSVITAVGMVDQLGVMMAAVVISIGVMLFASKPLTQFVNRHQTVVVLCLSFLLMIGLSLIAEGFGFHLPKGYLYAAIGFSIMIEAFNQLARHNRDRQEARLPRRERTAAAVMRLLGDRRNAQAMPYQTAVTASSEPLDEAPFTREQSDMVGSVLSLADKHARAIMTPRVDISWIDLEDDTAAIRDQVLASPHNMLPVCQGSLDNVIGVARAKDILGDLIKSNAIDTDRTIKTPIYVYENTAIVRLIDTLKQSKGKLVFITDEFGLIKGLCSPIDLLQAIAGEFPDEDEIHRIQPQGENLWLIQGSAPLDEVAHALGEQFNNSDTHDVSTLGGWLLHHFGRPPAVGESLDNKGLHFDIVAVKGNRITQVMISRQ